MRSKFDRIIRSSIEYIPIVLTVGFGGYVILRHQITPFSDTQILVWILTIISLLATSILVDRFSRLNRIENSSKEILSSLRNSSAKSIDSILATRKGLPALEERLGNSKEIFIAGGSLLRLTNEYINFFETKANEGCKMKFLLLSPESDAVRFVADSVVYEINDQEQYKRSVETSLANLRKLESRFSSNVEVRLYEVIPSFSILGSKAQKDSDSEIMVEFYTFKTPTRERPHIVLRKGVDPNWFQYFYEQFDSLWETGKEIKVES